MGGGATGDVGAGALTVGVGADVDIVVALGALVCALGVLLAVLVTAYRLMKHLGARSPGLWAAGMFIPCVSIFVLLAISSQAQQWCRRYGIQVGLLGPTRQSLERLQRGVV